MRLDQTKLEKASPELRAHIQSLTKELQDQERCEAARGDFIEFCRHMWPGFMCGRHHQIMADAFQRVIDGNLRRLIINMPPRHGKSELTSRMLPAWFIGKYPGKKIMMASHTADLSVGFGREVRNLIDSEDFASVFPGVGLRPDSKSAGRWNTNKNGQYHAVGIGAKIAGKGADLFIIDDAHSEQEGKEAQWNPAVFDKAYDWYTSGPRQRLQPGAAIIVVMTRWGKRDLTGRLLESAKKSRRERGWEVIELPMELPSGEPLWPEFWPHEEMLDLKDEMPTFKWMAQYQQQPTSEEGAIIKREWWRTWPHDTPPKCDFVIQSWDTAFLAKTSADFSACTTWGVFYHPDDTGLARANIILLDAFRDRLEFPGLKKMAKELFVAKKPDSVMIEAKASGWPLIFELRRMGIPVQDYTPSKGDDKISRLNSVSDLFASGIVWAPAGHKFAEEVIAEVAEFPNGSNDDYVDATTLALMRFRDGGFISLQSDDDDDDWLPRKKAAYY